MATETLSNFSTPKIDSHALRRQLFGVFLVNVVQGLYHTPGKGVNQSVIVDTDALEVRVLREKPLTQKARRIGATENGGYYNSNAYEIPTTDEYGIRVNLVLDQNIDIPANLENMIKLPVAQATTRNYEQLVQRNINASTIATQLAGYFNAQALVQDASGTPTWVSYTTGTDSILDKFQDANGVLDDGDATNGVDTFPAESRIALWRSSGKRDFYKTAKAVLDIGNWKAQEMLRVGAIDPVSVRNTDKNGFFGEIDSVYNYFVAPAIWTLSEEYMRQSGAPVSAGTLDEVVGYLCASMGTLRGIAMDSTLKMIDSPVGQGVRMQPKQRWGVELIYPGSVVAVVTASFTNPSYPASTVTNITIEAPDSNV